MEQLEQMLLARFKEMPPEARKALGSEIGPNAAAILNEYLPELRLIWTQLPSVAKQNEPEMDQIRQGLHQKRAQSDGIPSASGPPMQAPRPPQMQAPRPGMAPQQPRPGPGMAPPGALRGI